jgi:hypothetical protein
VQHLLRRAARHRLRRAQRLHSVHRTHLRLLRACATSHRRVRMALHRRQVQLPARLRFRRASSSRQLRARHLLLRRRPHRALPLRGSRRCAECDDASRSRSASGARTARSGWTSRRAPRAASGSSRRHARCTGDRSDRRTIAARTRGSGHTDPGAARHASGRTAR